MIRQTILGLVVAALPALTPVSVEAEPVSVDELCARRLRADVVALDQPFFFNRLGAHQPGGMIYALKRDVVPIDGDELRPGGVALREDLRPRPLTLRANHGDCLEIRFTNLLAPKPAWDQPATRWSGLHVVGLSLMQAFDGRGRRLDPIQADGSWVGTNPPSLVPPGASITYVYRADEPGSYLMHSLAGALGLEVESDTFNLQYPSGQMTAGLFGAVNVQPKGAVWYRSQVSADELARATVDHTPLGQPVIDYAARFDDGTPVLAMLDDDLHIVYGDLTAIVAYAGPDGPTAFPENPADPLFTPVPASPERTQPYREITAIYHQTFSTVQAFDCAYRPPVNPQTGERDYSLCQEPYARKLSPYLFDAIGVGEDRYAINYGSGGIGSEILANRFEVGPAGKCTGCKYEEFFLSSWPNGDPGQVVTLPAGASAALGLPEEALRRHQKALYPADPSNVYHSYMRDHVKFRVLQGAANFHHLHHQHAHQWLHTPNAKTSHYLDSQAIAPGTSFTLEMVYNGSGNRNETVGDAIFHCHFYPHFAEGMWALWRVHDVMETGTQLDDDGLPKAPRWHGSQLVEPGARALPDPEIARGTPIPAIVPLPDRPMPPMPATVTLDAEGDQALTVAEVDGRWQVVGRAGAVDPSTVDPSTVPNPGFPFFIPGLAGQRAPRPPLDVAYAKVTEPGDPAAGLPPTVAQASADEDGAEPLDGGLPRSIITGSADAHGPGTVELHTRLDFSKVLQQIDAVEIPEDGTVVEKIAMAAHARAENPTCLPDGTCDPAVEAGHRPGDRASDDYRPDISFRLNGLPPVAGAPYADPCGPEDGARWFEDPAAPRGYRVATRHYRGANIQLDVVLNKEGWHFPQQRIITLWDDVEPTLEGRRAPEPFFFRANSRECVEYWQANLVPSEYALDDFQVRTPTDILGQHIHLVKFDVTASDGAANGWNYEDGSLSPDEVRERIEAINAGGGLLGLDGKRRFLEAKIHPRFGPGPRGTWIGAMTTVQRWMADPLLPGLFEGDDRTIRTVFTHDHFSPSTHQQAGLYAGLLVEPEGSQWLDSRTGELMGGTDPATGLPVAGRSDGGPTSWRANIITADPADSFRELALEFQDIALAYPMASKAYPDPLAFGEIGVDPDVALDPVNLALSEIVRPLGQSPIPPWPQAVSSGGSLGTYSLNYRNEPLSARLADQAGFAPGDSADVPEAQDLAYVFRSMPRLRPSQNRQPPWYPPLTGGVQATDPYTPLLQAYEGDRVQIRTLVGAHELVHQFTLRGLSWLAEPSYLDSGYKNHQVMGISEHFEMQFTLPPNPEDEDADYVYFTDVSLQGLQRGSWGLLRSYDLAEAKDFLEPLPNNPVGAPHQSLSGIEYCSPESRAPSSPKHRTYDIYAVAVENFEAGTLTFMPETTIKVARVDEQGNVTSIDDVDTPIVSPEGLIYVHADDIEEIQGDGDGETRRWRLKPGREFEPLVLRAAAGDCLEVRLTNYFDPADRAFNFDLPGVGDENQRDPRCSVAEYLEMKRNPHNFIGSFKADSRCFGSNKASTSVGLYPQLVAFDPTASSGMNLGLNPVQTVKPAVQGGRGTHTSYWYAGKVEWNEERAATWTPVEFGAANLLSADVLHQHSKGLFGALIIEPEGSTWTADAGTRISATVTKADGESFREHVMMISDDLEIYWRDPDTPEGAVFEPVPVVSAEAIAAVNYSTDFLLFKLAPPAPWSVAVDPDDRLTVYDQTDVDQTELLRDQVHGGDPATPVFTAHAGDPVRFRVLHPGGIFEGHVFTLNGHGWQERPYGHRPNPSNPDGDPYRAVAQFIGDNELAEWKGQQLGIGPNAHFDAVIEPTSSLPTAGAGGAAHVPGDYLYRSFPAVFFEGGFWGIFRVGPKVPDGELRDVVAVTTATFVDPEAGADGGAVVTGSNSSILGTPDFAPAVHLFAGRATEAGCDGEHLATVDIFSGAGPDRQWRWQGPLPGGTTHVCVLSEGGGLDDSPIFRRDRPPFGDTVLSPPLAPNTVASTPTPLHGASKPETHR